MRRQTLNQILLACALAVGVLTASSFVWADDNAQLKQQIQELQNRVNQLQAQLADRQQVPMPPAMPVYGQWQDPFAQMMLEQQQMDRAMRQAFAETGIFTPRTDMRQTDKQYIVTMDLPGMDKDKINVQIKQGMLIISGERRSETQDNGNTSNNQFYRQERSFGSFMQAVPLPEDAQKDKIDATYKNGVLTVTIDRAPKQAPKQENQKIIVR